MESRLWEQSMVQKIMECFQETVISGHAGLNTRIQNGGDF